MYSGRPTLFIMKVRVLASVRLFTRWHQREVLVMFRVNKSFFSGLLRCNVPA